jgi:DNA-binding NarL/FixJ family response regulator
MHQLKALLVEDDPLFRSMLAELLSNEFPEILVDQAGDGGSLFSHLDGSTPDVILMDIDLPGENGLVLTRFVKKMDPNIVVVIVSNYDLPEYRQAAFRQGADCYIPKSSATCAKEIVARVAGVMTRVSSHS